jgi:hypothetical protein
MTISKKYSKRGGHFLKLDFEDEKDYHDLVEALKKATKCFKECDKGDATDTQCEDNIVSNIERLKVIEEDGRVSSTIFQEDMMNLFCCLFDMTHLIVGLDKTRNLMKENIELYKQINGALEKKCSLLEEQSDIQKQISDKLETKADLLSEILDQHKFIIHMISNEGLVLDDKGKERWCKLISAPSSNDPN